MSRQTSISDFFGTPRPSPRTPESNTRPSRPEASSTSKSSPAPSPSQMSSASSSRGRGGGRGGRGGANNTRRNNDLAKVAAETVAVLPDILSEIPHVNAAYSVEADLSSLSPLSSASCPRRGAATVKVINEDTINAALDLAAAHTRADGPVAILNLASDKVAGGGWLKGARAQEEALCYRSSLSLSLHRRYYPFRSGTTCLYTPDMVVIRSDSDSGHDLLVPAVAPRDLPVISCVSVAALRNPPVVQSLVTTLGGNGTPIVQETFARPQDREMTKAKMRISLRVAATHGHGLLVLGALGCGAFHNPKHEVAKCWSEVLLEPEFAGGWWKEIVFAVYDKRNEGNYDVFQKVLGGLQV